MKTYEVIVSKGAQKTPIQVSTDGGPDDAKKHVSKIIASGAHVVPGDSDALPQIESVTEV